MFIKDCIIGTKMLFESKERSVLNIGSEEQVSINQMINLIEEISDYKVNKNYQLDKPKGVRGRSSNNDLIKKKIGWDVSVTLREGLKETYEWIYKQMTSGSNNNKFSRKY
jgi:nucleoside-diphosphate-sugar epimerase